MEMWEMAPQNMYKPKEVTINYKRHQWYYSLFTAHTHRSRNFFVTLTQNDCYCFKSHTLLNIKVPTEVELYQDINNTRTFKQEYFSGFKLFSFPLTSTFVTHKKQQIPRY
jgi:hypothetical protein